MSYCSKSPVSLSANLHDTLDLLFTTFSLHDLPTPRTSWCVEPVSNEAFYYLNPECSHPSSLTPSLSPTVCILPFTLHLAAACCFCWRGKEQDSPGKKSLADKIPSLSLRLPGEAEEWKVPRPSVSAERLSKNKANHMAANPGVDEGERERERAL